MAGFFGTHIGSWGTPDFGLTERISSAFGQGRTAQGGSNMYGNQAQTTLVPSSGGNYVQSGAPGAYGNTGLRSMDLGTSGRVLGSSTTNTTNTGGSGGGSTPSAPAGFDRFNKNANPGTGWGWHGDDGGWKPEGGEQPVNQNQVWLDEINRAFDGLLGGLGGQQEQEMGFARGTADTQKAGINEQLGFGVNNLNLQRGEVRDSQADTLSNLAQSLRDTGRNVGNMLGAKGANGSAMDHASYALTKLYGNQRAGVLQQSRGQLNDIATAENNLKAGAAQMMNEVETWFTNAQQEIVGKFNQLRNNIGQMKAGARLDAVAQLEAEYRDAERQRDEISRGIQDQARQRLMQLNDYKTQLAGMSQFSPEQQTYNEFNFNPAAYQQDQAFDFNPMALASKKKKEQGLV